MQSQRLPLHGQHQLPLTIRPACDVSLPQVKSMAAESALPNFDFDKKVGRKMALQKFRRQVGRASVGQHGAGAMMAT